MNRARGLVLVVLVAALALDAAQARPRPIVSRPPAGLRAGDVWVVAVRNAPRQARFEIRLGTARRWFALRKGRARVTFPTPGTWQYGISRRGRFARLGSARVLPRRLILLQPMDIVEVGPWYVITDRLANAVYRVDRATGTWRRIATAPEARELAIVDERTLILTSAGNVLRLDLVTGATERVAEVDGVVLGIERAAGGDLYVSVGDRVLRMTPDGSRSIVIAGRDGIHGLALDGNRLIVCESYAGNVLGVELASGRVETLARGLGNPSFAIPFADGVYVSEFSAGRISVLGSDGSVRPIAVVSQVGPIFHAPDGTLLAVTLDGRALRLDPRTGRVTSLLR